MGNLVFQATLGGQVNLVGPNTASTFNLNVPAVAGTLVTTGDTGTVSSTMLASSLSLTTPNINVATGTSLKVSAGFYSTSSSSFTYTDGIVMDYTTGLGRISVGTSDGVAFYNGGVATTELMRLDASGNLGVGTTSPVNGASLTTLTVYNSTQPALYLQNSTTGTTATDGLSIAMSGVDCYFNNREAGNIITYVNGAERTRIDSSGNLLVGVTSTSFASTGGFAALPGSQGGGITAFNTHGNWSAFGVTSGATGTESAIKFYFGTTPTVVGSITVTSTATAYNVVSDRRLKTNIVDFTDSGRYIDAFKPRSFTWSDGTSDIGFVTDEYQQTLPSAISGEPDAVDEEGNPIYQQGDFSTSAKMAIIVAELQSVRKRLAVLEAK